MKRPDAYLIHHRLPETNQSFWALSVIQLTGVMSLPVLATSILLIQSYSILTSMLTLILGNLILWVIRYAIIAMSYKGRKSSLDLTIDYVGKIGSYFVSIAFLVSTLAWFVDQTTIASGALTTLIPIEEGKEINRFIQTSVALGILSTLLCMEGISVLRWLSLISFPILVLSFLIILFLEPNFTQNGMSWGISLSGLSLVLATNLGVTADIPTFFRHSRSWRTSVNALTTIQLISLAIAIGGLFVGAAISPWLSTQNGQIVIENELLKLGLIFLIFVSVICANVSNVYSASVAWEIVAPILAGRKEYLILGLSLTIVFILVTGIFSFGFLLETSDNSLVNLCLVFLAGFVASILLGRPPTLIEKWAYFLAWLSTSIINALQTYALIPSKNLILLTSTSIIAFLALTTVLLELYLPNKKKS